MATIEGTRRCINKFSEIKFKELGKTGLTTSICGFGSYRVDVSVKDHRAALEHCLRQGINLIDSSSNYANGGSEELIGNVLNELIKSNSLNIDNVIVVTKGGYLQGDNLDFAKKKEKSGRGFEEVVKCSPDLWHCIHPEFLEDQITRSLKRLKLDKIDFYLLHNPEYFLTYSGINDKTKRNNEYYNRIEKAFRHLEKEVEKGRISYYGISSNTFGEFPEKNNFSSLERIIEIAEQLEPTNHFAIIEMPLNLIERGSVLNKNQIELKKTVLELANENNLGVLINRSLNAIVNNKIVRLADFRIKENRTTDEINIFIDDLNKQEENLIKKYVIELSVGASEKKSITDCLSLGRILKENIEKFESPNHFKEVKGYYLVPRANYAVSQLTKFNPNDEKLIGELKNYALTNNILFDSIESELARKYNKQNQKMHEKINKFLNPEQKSLTLSQKAILMNNSLKEVSCTLVGMRTKSYVDDVLGSIKADYIELIDDAWEN